MCFARSAIVCGRWRHLASLSSGRRQLRRRRTNAAPEDITALLIDLRESIERPMLLVDHTGTAVAYEPRVRVGSASGDSDGGLDGLLTSAEMEMYGIRERTQPYADALTD